MTNQRDDSQRNWQSETGGLIEGSDEAAFVFRSLSEPPVPIVVAVPHAGRLYPKDLLDDARDPTLLERRLEDRFVDEIARRVSASLGASLLVANAPRAMLDLNRSEDDIDWGMIAGRSPAKQRTFCPTRRAQSGLGLVPRRLAGVGELWRRPLTYERLQARIDGVHWPYHQKLSAELLRLREIWGRAILVDIHSMPPVTRTGEIDFVIGDRFGTSCAASFSGAIMSQLRCDGRNVAHNRPYSGCYVLDRHGRPQQDIHALQIEICRSTYLDASLDRPTLRVDKIAELVAGALGSGLLAVSGYDVAAE